MGVRLAKKKDAGAIARIHKNEIAGGFLASLPLRFLTVLYRAIIAFSGGFCVVAKENGKVVGFVSGLTDIKAFYKYFLSRFFWAGFLLAPIIFSPGAAKRVLENFSYPKQTKELPQAELVSIAVSKDFRGRGIASQMLPLFIEEMKRRDVKIFKLVVGESLSSAIRFYEKSGFRFVEKISLHGKESSRVYVYDIN